jgi:hypothetical protein
LHEVQIIPGVLASNSLRFGVIAAAHNVFALTFDGLLREALSGRIEYIRNIVTIRRRVA